MALPLASISDLSFGRPAGLMVRRGSVWKVRGKFIKNKQAKVRGAAGMAYTLILLFTKTHTHLSKMLVNAKWISVIDMYDQIYTAFFFSFDLYQLPVLMLHV